MQGSNVRELSTMSMCLALCCVTAYISFPLPFTPGGLVTALTFAVILAYILLGAAGLPVFAGGLISMILVLDVNLWQAATTNSSST